MKKKPLNPNKWGNLTRDFNKTINKKLSSDNTDNFIGHGIDIENRVIHLTDDIDAQTSGRVIKGLQLMMVKNKEKDIDIYINSFGGCPYSSIGLYNFIRTLKTCDVNTYNIGCAMSGGSIIFMAGDNRYMYEDTVFMIHSVSSGAEGKVYLDLVEEADECKRIHADLCKIYARHTNKSEKQWHRLIEHKNRYYRAEKAIEMGIVHKVIVDNDDKKY